MEGTQIHRLSSKILVVLSLIALLTVGTGYFEPPQHDEGTAAHIFQLAIVLTVLVGLLFFMTADWHRPLHSIRPLALPSAALFLAFAALYYLEHHR